MFKNYLKTAWRNLLRDKLYSFINIGGLSIGIAVCMLIMLYVAHENSYDKFHKNADRIYSVYAKEKSGSDTLDIPFMSFGTGPSIIRNSPLVESFVRTYQPFSNIVIANPASTSLKFSETKILFADSNFFNFFSFHLKKGNIESVLERPFTMVITEQAARKYFGNVDPIGHTLKYDNSTIFEITGIVEQTPSNSSIDYDFIGSLSSVPAMKGGENINKLQGSVMPGEYGTYLLLKQKVNPQDVLNTIKYLAKNNKSPDGFSERYYLSPFLNTHLHTVFADDTNTKYLKIFMLIAGLILILALINYMSLATARATLRAKEIGVRKVIGGTRRNIAKQFFVESALYVLIAFIAGYIIFTISRPYFFNLIDLKIDTPFVFSPVVFLIFFALLMITILSAGTYPAIILSSFNPIAVLYGRWSAKRSGNVVRKLFTVLQFTISVALIIFSITVQRQMYFLRHTDTGISRKNIIMIPIANTIGNHYYSFKNEVSELSGVRDVATSHYSMYGGTDNIVVLRKNENQPISLHMLNVDGHFISLFDIKWKIPPPKEVYNLPNMVIINTAAISGLNLSSNPINEQIEIKGGPKLTVSGVMQNFNFNSLHYKIEPLCLIIRNDTSISWGSAIDGTLFVKTKDHTNIPGVIEAIKKIHDSYDKETPFEFNFVDDVYNAQYKAEERLSNIMGLFTGLNIFIACLGLLGLSTFLAIQKNKEISIRKVLGATEKNLILLLSKNFILLVFISNIIAFPFAWYVCKKWLEGFVYRIDIGWEVFLSTFFLTIIIAFITIVFQTIRVAIANPIVSLRTE